jgi:hypothetical protein
VDHGLPGTTLGRILHRTPITVYLAFGGADGNTGNLILRHCLDFVHMKRRRQGMVPWQMDDSPAQKLHQLLSSGLPPPGMVLSL